LRIDLEAFVDAAPENPLSGDWEGTTSVEDQNGSSINSVQVPAGGSRTVVAVVTPPTSGLTFGQTARLTLRTSVAPPTNRSHDDFVDLKVDAAETPSVPHDVIFTEIITPPTNNPNVGKIKSTYAWSFGVLYTGGPSSARFRVVVSLTANMSEGWKATINDLTDATTSPTGQPGVFVREIELADNQAQQVSVIIWTPTNASSVTRTAAFNVAVESVDEALVPSVKATHSDTFTVIVPGNTIGGI
jgi:hypothetical protein